MRNSRLSILFVTRIKALPLLDEFTLLCGPGPKKVVFAVFRHFSTEATEGNGGANYKQALKYRSLIGRYTLLAGMVDFLSDRS